MSTGLGKIQVEVVVALAAVETATPGRGASPTELARLIFDRQEITEAMRASISRACTKLEREKLAVRIIEDGQRSRDIRVQLHSNIIRTLIRPVTDKDTYLKRVKRWLE